MKRKEEIVEQQKAFVQHLKERTSNTVRKLCRGEAGGETDGTQASY